MSAAKNDTMKTLPNITRPIVLLGTIGCMFGAVSVLVASVAGNYLVYVPVLPGALIVVAFCDRSTEVVAEDGLYHLELLVPANALFYGMIGVLVGVARHYRLRRRRGNRSPHCAGCGYLLVGNTSGVCPECGTPLSPSQRRQLPRSSKTHRSSPRREPRAEEVAGRDDDPGRPHPF
jgi:hypothetical protein